MKYEDIYPLLEKLRKALDKYVTERNEVNSIYYTAKKLLVSISQRSYRNQEYRDLVGGWLVWGGTLRLKNILTGVEYDNDNLVHFNAFVLLDTVVSKQLNS